MSPPPFEHRNPDNVRPVFACRRCRGHVQMEATGWQHRDPDRQHVAADVITVWTRL